MGGATIPLAQGYKCPHHDLPRKELNGLVPAEIGATCHMNAAAVVKVASFVYKECFGHRTGPTVVILTNGCRGHGHAKSQRISIPLWVMHHPNHAFQVYYIAHEVAHLWAGGSFRPDGEGVHGPFFKRTERRVLKKLGMGITYQKAYPRVLRALKDGRELYVSPQEHVRRTYAAVAAIPIRPTGVVR